jgi:uncharacterized protein (TIGR02246 family)
LRASESKKLHITNLFYGDELMQLSRRATIIGGVAAAILGGLTVSESAFGEGSPGSQEDEAAIRRYVENFDRAWNAHDPDALFGKRAKQIDRINAFGGWIKTPEADERVMRRLFAGPFGQSKHKIQAERIRFLTPNVAIVVIHMVRISVGATAGPASDRGNRSIHVLVKHEGDWELEAFANVPILPPSGAVKEAEGEDVTYSDPIH